MAATAPNNLRPIINSNGQAVGYSATGQPASATPSAPAGNSQSAAPGSASSNYTSYNADGSTTNYANGVPTTTPAPTGRLNAVIADTTNKKADAPTVITSDTASKDFANKQNQINQLNQDTQQHQQVMQQPPAQPLSDKQTDGGSSQQTSPTKSSAGALDDQIQSIISGLAPQTKAVNDSANKQESAITDAQTQEQNDQNAAYASTMAKLQSITQGTYPLSPAESALVSSTASMFQQTIQAQQTANQAYTGQMTELMASLGINTSAPTQAIGQIQATIDSGNQKVAGINAQMSQSLATLQEGFQKQDFDQVQTAWADAAAQFTERNNSLKDMLASVQKSQEDQISQIKDNTTMALSAIMDSNTIQYQQKQTALDQARLNETIRHDQATEIQDNLVTSFAQGSNVPLGANGKPDPVGQAQFLAKLPQDQANIIKGLSDYTINPSSLPTRQTKGMGGLTQQQALALTKAYDPSYDEKSYATRAAMQKNITSGAYSQTINAANTAVQHLNELATDYSALGNKSIPLVNAGYQSIRSATGAAAPNNFKITADAVASELSKIYKGTGAPAESEINNWRDSISDSMSPAQFQGALKTAMNLMAGKMSTLSDNYTSIMGQPGDFQILTDKNAATLNSLGIDPSAIDPTYGNSPTIKLSNFNGASPENAALLKQVNSVAPNATPDEIVQYLQGQGYEI